MRYFLKAALLALTSLSFISISHASEEISKVISRHPSPSPTGSEVVYEADFDKSTSQTHLWISSLDGSKLRKIQTNSIADEEPAWSPTGQLIAFASTNNGVTDIWTVQPNGTHLRQLTANSLNNRQPTWSSNGEKIVFVSDRGGSNDIWVMNIDGTQQTRLSKLPGQEDHPSISPAGDRIVFSETVNNAATLMVMNIDGTGLTSLTTGKFNDWNPNWGVNGIAFSSDRDTSSEHFKIWVIQPNGTGLRKIGDVIGLDPAWMPDGRILFSDEFNAFKAQESVSVLDVATGKKRVVSNVQGYLNGSKCSAPPNLQNLKSSYTCMYPESKK